MINFLHTFQPNAILLSFGPITIYWYGLFVVSGILASFFVILKLAEYYNLNKNNIIDVGFWVIVFGIIGARLYHVGLELPYYLSNPINIIKIWNGGLAIHGGILFGGITAFYLVKKLKINFWQFAAICVPGLALGQAIGRWGNYFNQELYGFPTSAPWGIPISTINKIPEYLNSDFFHPTFIYESIGNLIIFSILFLVHLWIVKNKKQDNFYYIICVLSYLSLYSILRFSLEFIRIDTAPSLLGLRFPQVISIVILVISALFFVYTWRKQKGLINN